MNLPTNEEVTDKLITIISENIVGAKGNIFPKSGTGDFNLKALNIDSLAFVKLVVLIEDAFKIEVPDDHLIFENFDSVLKITKLVQQCYMEQKDEYA
jgi:acyl carrier protein